MSHKFSITIPWDSSTETFILDLASPPRVGERFTTSESWPEDDDLLVTYSTRAISYEKSGTRHTLCLRYSLENNRNLAMYDLCWGVSTIILDTERMTCKATWRSIPADKDYDGTSVARVQRLKPSEVIEYQTCLRIKRNQQKFKASLLQYTKVCELTGESAASALDAAHITGVSESGTYSADNGLLLRADLHRLFDANLLQISANNGRVTLSKRVPKDSYYHFLVKDMKLASASLERIHANLKKRKLEG